MNDIHDFEIMLGLVYDLIIEGKTYSIYERLEVYEPCHYLVCIKRKNSSSLGFHIFDNLNDLEKTNENSIQIDSEFFSIEHALQRFIMLEEDLRKEINVKEK